MASVNDKRKAAGTGGEKRSAPGATYSKNKTVGKDTTPQVEAAYNNLSAAQKNAASSLGLDKAQATQLDERQAGLINANVGHYSEAKKQQLKNMYSNVTNDRIIRSGSSGMSKIETQQYKQAAQQKSFGTSVSVVQAQHVITRSDPESRASQLKSFNATTNKWEIPTSTLQNLSGKIRTRGDMMAVESLAQRGTFTATVEDRQKIQLARDHVIKTSSNPEKTRRIIEYNDSLKTAKTPLTGPVTFDQARAIRKAREEIIKSYPTEGKYTRADAATYFKFLDTQPFAKAQTANFKAFVDSGQIKKFRTKDQIKQDEMDKNLKEFAGDSAVKGFVADLYRVTATWDNLKKSEMPMTNPRISQYMKSSGEIEVIRDQKLEKAGLLDAQRRGQKLIMSNSALAAINDYGVGKYNEVKQRPASVGVDVAKFVAECAVMGAAFKSVGFVGGKVLSGVGTKAYKVSPKAVQNVARRVGRTKNNIPVVRKITAQNLPEVGMGAYIGEQILRAGVKGSKVDGVSIGEIPGSAYTNLYNAKKAGKDVNYVTVGNIDLGVKLAAGAPFVAHGAKVASGKLNKIDYSVTKTPRRTLATNIPKPTRSKGPIGTKVIRLEKTQPSKTVSKQGRNYYRERKAREAEEKAILEQLKIAADEAVSYRASLKAMFKDERAVASLQAFKIRERGATQVLLTKPRIEMAAQTTPKKWGRNVYRERLAREEAAQRQSIKSKVKTPLQEKKSVRSKTYKGKPKAKELTKTEIARERTKLSERMRLLSSTKDKTLLNTNVINFVKEINAIKTLNENVIKQAVRTEVKTAQITKQIQNTAQKQEVKTEVKQVVKQQTPGKPEFKNKLQDIPVIPPLPRRKKSTGDAVNTGRKVRKAHRTRKNTMGSFESMFGISAMKSKRPTKRRTTTKRGKK